MIVLIRATSTQDPDQRRNVQSSLSSGKLRRGKERTRDHKGSFCFHK